MEAAGPAHSPRHRPRHSHRAGVVVALAAGEDQDPKVGAVQAAVFVQQL